MQSVAGTSREASVVPCAPPRQDASATSSGEMKVDMPSGLGPVDVPEALQLTASKETVEGDLSAIVDSLFTTIDWLD